MGRHYEPLSSDDSVGVGNTVPYVENYMLGIQRGIGRNTVATINYVGNEGKHLPNSEEANPGRSRLTSANLSLSTKAEMKSGHRAACALEGKIISIPRRMARSIWERAFCPDRTAISLSAAIPTC